MVERFINTAEFAELARTSPSTCRYWRHIGYGPKGFRVGKRVLYVEAEVLAWLDSLRRSEGAA
jgi:DNA-binding transcriptional MerR regulator